MDAAHDELEQFTPDPHPVGADTRNGRVIDLRIVEITQFPISECPGCARSRNTSSDT